ncbi:NAD-binding protein [Cupriavidus basilensis]
MIAAGQAGQIIGRLLYAQGIGVTALDYDPDQIEFLRQYGFKIFYGDATRLICWRRGHCQGAHAGGRDRWHGRQPVPTIACASATLELRIYARARYVPVAMAWP